MRSDQIQHKPGRKMLVLVHSSGKTAWRLWCLLGSPRVARRGVERQSESRTIFITDLGWNPIDLSVSCRVNRGPSCVPKPARLADNIQRVGKRLGVEIS